MINVITRKILESKKRVKENKWAVWSWIVLGLAVVFMLGYALVTDKLLSGKVAKVKHDRDVLKEKDVQNELSGKLGALEVKKQRVIQSLQERSVEIRRQEAEEKLVREHYEQNKEDAGKLSTWEDINSSVAFRKPRDPE